MATPYSDVFDRFQNKLLKDPDFFYYNNMSLVEVEKIIKEKCKILLNEAISELYTYCVPDVNMYDKDDCGEIFNVDLTEFEKELLANLMLQKYMEQDLVRLKVLMNNFSNNELNVFSPANERKSFIELIENIQYKNMIRINNYIMKDRMTGKYKSINGGEVQWQTQ